MEKAAIIKSNCIPRTFKALTVELNKPVQGQEWLVFGGLCAFSPMLFAEQPPKGNFSDEMYGVWSGVYNIQATVNRADRLVRMSTPEYLLESIGHKSMPTEPTCSLFWVCPAC